jgi:hypothetical protein
MFNKKYKKKQLKNELQILNANNAHKEMVIKSGGGINNLFQNLQDAFYIIELNNQKIARLNYEINNLESRLVELSVNYKFKNRFFILEVNKFLLIDKIKKIKIIKVYIYVNGLFKKYFLNKIKNINKIKIANYFSLKKIFKFIIILLNLLFLINNINNINKII